MRSSVRCTELCYAALSRPRPARQLDAVVELCCDDVLCDKSSALPKLCTPACAQQFNAFYAACQDRIEAQVSWNPPTGRVAARGQRPGRLSILRVARQTPDDFADFQAFKVECETPRDAPAPLPLEPVPEPVPEPPAGLCTAAAFTAGVDSMKTICCNSTACDPPPTACSADCDSFYTPFYESCSTAEMTLVGKVRGARYEHTCGVRTTSVAERARPRRMARSSSASSRSSAPARSAPPPPSRPVWTR